MNKCMFQALELNLLLQMNKCNHMLSQRSITSKCSYNRRASWTIIYSFHSSPQINIKFMLIFCPTRFSTLKKGVGFFLANFFDGNIAIVKSFTLVVVIGVPTLPTYNRSCNHCCNILIFFVINLRILTSVHAIPSWPKP